ncbi:hypothetical protein MTO96_022491 [Rhipicephalus appendiculatus]
MPRRKAEWTYAEMGFSQLEQQQQKPPRWFSSEREEAVQQKRQRLKIEINMKDPATTKQYQQACGGPWQTKLEENIQ